MEEQGNLNEATGSYRKAIQIKSDYYQAHQFLGQVLLKEGNLDEAFKEYSYVSQHDKGNPLLHLTLGKILLKTLSSPFCKFDSFTFLEDKNCR